MIEAGREGNPARLSRPPIADAIIDAIPVTSSLTIRPPQSSRTDEVPAMTKPITLTSRLVDAVVTAAMSFSLIVHAQFMILPPHFV